MWKCVWVCKNAYGYLIEENLMDLMDDRHLDTYVSICVCQSISVGLYVYAKVIFSIFISLSDTNTRFTSLCMCICVGMFVNAHTWQLIIIFGDKFNVSLTVAWNKGKINSQKDRHAHGHCVYRIKIYTHGCTYTDTHLQWSDTLRLQTPEGH